MVLLICGDLGGTNARLELWEYAEASTPAPAQLLLKVSATNGPVCG
jgi:glucokinase